MEFYSLAGKMALGSRLRRLADTFTFDAKRIYALYGVDIDPKWFPVFYLLSHKDEASITDIAKDIGHSHPSVSNTVKEMAKAKIVTISKAKKDSRVTIVKLSSKGKKLSLKAEKQFLDVAQAVERLQVDADIDLFHAVEKTEIQLEQQNFYDRVRTERKARENENVKIIEYSLEYQNKFAELNIEWIEQHWEMEEADYHALNDPESYILKPGGFIFLALYNDEIVGTCALINREDSVFELAKMAVTPKEKGKGIGFLLGNTIIDKALSLEANSVYLESNTVLEAALKLYEKLGFKKSQGISSPYQRCNIKMELNLIQSTHDK